MASLNTGKKSLAAVVGTGAAAILFAVVPKFEGTVYKTYPDPIGILTYCTGATTGAVAGKTYTPAECRAQLEKDLLIHAERVKSCTTKPMSTGETAAFVSFDYNTGKYCGSTANKLVNAGKPAEACAQLSKWIYAGGRVLPGLVARRKTERAICEGETQ